KSKNATSIIERFNGTLRGMLNRIFILTNNWNYIDYLHDVIDQYNKSPHSGINGMVPLEINESEMIKNYEEARLHNLKVQQKLKKRYAGFEDDPPKETYVRVRLIAGKFDKKSNQIWSDKR